MLNIAFIYVETLNSRGINNVNIRFKHCKNVDDLSTIYSGDVIFSSTTPGLFVATDGGLATVSGGLRTSTCLHEAVVEWTDVENKQLDIRGDVTSAKSITAIQIDDENYGNYTKIRLPITSASINQSGSPYGCTTTLTFPVDDTSVQKFFDQWPEYADHLIVDGGIELYYQTGELASEPIPPSVVNRFSRTSEGMFTTVGLAGHAEGIETVAQGFFSHTEGNSTKTYGEYAHAEGYKTTCYGVASHTEGARTTTTGQYSHAEGEDTTASGRDSHAQGFFSVASGPYSFAGGSYSTAEGSYSFAIGKTAIARGTASVAMGETTTAVGICSTVLGSNCVANANYSVAMGYGCSTESGATATMALGYNCKSKKQYATSFGAANIASGNYAVAAGGLQNTASGSCSLATGYKNESSGSYAVTFGKNNLASNMCSFACGYQLKTAKDFDFLIGQYNAPAYFGKAAFVVANGAGESDRRNLVELSTDGKLILQTGFIQEWWIHVWEVRYPSYQDTGMYATVEGKLAYVNYELVNTTKTKVPTCYLEGLGQQNSVDNTGVKLTTNKLVDTELVDHAMLIGENSQITFNYDVSGNLIQSGEVDAYQEINNYLIQNNLTHVTVLEQMDGVVDDLPSYPTNRNWNMEGLQYAPVHYRFYKVRVTDSVPFEMHA